MGQTFAAYPFAELHSDVSLLARKHHLNVIDSLGAFREEMVSEVAQSSAAGTDPWHPSAAGFALLANYLADALGPQLALK